MFERGRAERLEEVDRHAGHLAHAHRCRERDIVCEADLLEPDRVVGSSLGVVHPIDAYLDSGELALREVERLTEGRAREPVEIATDAGASIEAQGDSRDPAALAPVVHGLRDVELI